MIEMSIEDFYKLCDKHLSEKEKAEIKKLQDRLKDTVDKAIKAGKNKNEDI